MAEQAVISEAASEAAPQPELPPELTFFVSMETVVPPIHVRMSADDGSSNALKLVLQVSGAGGAAALAENTSEIPRRADAASLLAFTFSPSTNPLGGTPAS